MKSPEKCFGELCNRIARLFVSQGIEAQDLIATLPEARQRVFERHYPELVEQESTCKREK